MFLMDQHSRTVTCDRAVPAPGGEQNNAPYPRNTHILVPGTRQCDGVARQ